jgi:hypothetical protein
VIVVAVAYGKLFWTNRYLKKHQIIDEEKRARAQELRNSGQLVENPKNDVPFGVRAIQSGIQVDGIWISNSNTPAPSELNLSLRGSSSESISEGKSSKSVNFSSGRPSFASNSGTIPPPRPKSEVQFQDRSNGSAFVEHTEGSTYLEPGSSKSYQPRRSSGLRYHDTRSHHEATLADLESGASHPMLQPQLHPPRISSKVNSGASSVADNELNSGTSSNSDDTLDPKNKGKGKAKEYMAVAQDDTLPSHNGAPPSVGYAAFHDDQSRPDRTSSLPQQDTDTAGMSWPLPPTLDHNKDPSPPRPRSHFPFRPGELHQNKVVRKINSGFEVLPAGTFGSPTPLKGEEVSADEVIRKSEDSTGYRKRNKLQKKRRESALSTRSSITPES